MSGTEWIIEAYGCSVDALRDPALLERLFERIIQRLALTPVGPAAWHAFPSPGGVTGFVVLAESHLACHTFPEFGSICLNVFCCRPRPEVDLRPLLAEMLGASDASLRTVARDYVGTTKVRG